MTALAGGTAVVTGAGSGLGAAMAAAFAAEGMGIAALDINREAAESVATDLAAGGGEAISVPVDVAERASLDAAVTAVAERFGAVNVLCANVGVQQFGPLELLTADDWQWVLSVNVIGTANTVAAFLPLVRVADGPRHIVLTSSIAALAPSPRQGAYIVSKFAVTGYGDVLRQEVADDGIGVTVLFPNGMMTNHIESSTRHAPARSASRCCATKISKSSSRMRARAKTPSPRPKMRSPISCTTCSRASPTSSRTAPSARRSTRTRGTRSGRPAHADGARPAGRRRPRSPLTSRIALRR